MSSSTKIIYIVMVEKKNGSLLQPIAFESLEDAHFELSSRKNDSRVLYAWIVTAPLHKKQHNAA